MPHVCGREHDDDYVGREPPGGDVKKLIGEIHRRSLWQVLGIYLAGSWIAIQAVETMYESYVETPVGLRMFTDHYMLPHAVERAAELYDQRGDAENAAKYYARFVELWADADPELQPRVEAARGRLEEILAERG